MKNLITLSLCLLAASTASAWQYMQLYPEGRVCEYTAASGTDREVTYRWETSGTATINGKTVQRLVRTSPDSDETLTCFLDETDGVVTYYVAPAGETDPDKFIPRKVIDLGLEDGRYYMDDYCSTGELFIAGATRKVIRFGTGSIFIEGLGLLRDSDPGVDSEIPSDIPAGVLSGVFQDGRHIFDPASFSLNPEYVPMVRDDRIWVYGVYGDLGGCHTLFNKDDIYKETGMARFLASRFDGTVELNGKTYHRLVTTDIGPAKSNFPDFVYQKVSYPVFYLREEDRKVYLYLDSPAIDRSEDSNAQETEMVIYDFQTPAETAVPYCPTPGFEFESSLGTEGLWLGDSRHLDYGFLYEHVPVEIDGELCARRLTLFPQQAYVAGIGCLSATVPGLPSRGGTLPVVNVGAEPDTQYMQFAYILIGVCKFDLNLTPIYGDLDVDVLTRLYDYLHAADAQVPVASGESTAVAPTPALTVDPGKVWFTRLDGDVDRLKDSFGQSTGMHRLLRSSFEGTVDILGKTYHRLVTTDAGPLEGNYPEEIYGPTSFPDMYLRQEGEKVYVSRLFDINANKWEPEALLYDFGLSKGDSYDANLSEFRYRGISWMRTFASTLKITGTESCDVAGTPCIMQHAGDYRILQGVGNLDGGFLPFLRKESEDGFTIGTGPYHYDYNLVRVEDRDENVLFSNTGSTGVTGPEADTLSPEDCRYYNLQGMPVSDPRRGEVYILRSPSGSRKVIF